MAFEFRFAEEADLEEIVNIEKASMSNPWALSSYKEALDSEHAFIYVATESGNIAGFCVLYLTPPESEIPDIVIDKQYRNKGLGKVLLDNVIKELKSQGIDTVFLEVRVSNEPARALYEKVGFEQIGVRKYFYSNPLEDAICMSLTI